MLKRFTHHSHSGLHAVMS